ncbi:annexin A2 [Cololabis saira]|uniref:annexin A2 n=1 Tax=Cololabis saira TaxID=129043 RepID=UPI002AD3D78B|nr:annexin A2 [Cololabis saira]XP_061597077.1 annexin A2 [Cololabis saira]
MDPEYTSYTMSWGTLGTVRPFTNFQPERDVMEVQAALEKKDTVTLVRILTNRNNAQRQVISRTFEEKSGKNLSVALKKSMSGDLEDLLLLLLLPPDNAEAQRLQQAMAGLGTDEETLMEILSTRSGKQLQDISTAYRQLFKKDLEKELRGETSGDFSKLLMALMKKHNVPAVVQSDVEALAGSLSGKKVDAGQWINIFSSRHPDHLNKVLMGLELETGQMVSQIVEKRFSGDFRSALKVLVQCIQSPADYLAKRLSTMKTSMVHGIMVCHSEEDLLCVRVAYRKLTGTSLYSALQNHFKGEHLQALQAICRSED